MPAVAHGGNFRGPRLARQLVRAVALEPIETKSSAAMAYDSPAHARMRYGLILLAWAGWAITAGAQAVGTTGYPVLEPRPEDSACLVDLHKFVKFDPPGSVEVLRIADNPARAPISRIVDGRPMAVRIVPMSIRTRKGDGGQGDVQAYYCYVDPATGRVVGIAPIGELPGGETPGR